jgi:hypothetical protein
MFVAVFVFCDRFNNVDDSILRSVSESLAWGDLKLASTVTELPAGFYLVV